MIYTMGSKMQAYFFAVKYADCNESGGLTDVGGGKTGWKYQFFVMTLNHPNALIRNIDPIQYPLLAGFLVNYRAAKSTILGRFSISLTRSCRNPKAMHWD